MIPFPFQFGGFGSFISATQLEADPYFPNVSLLLHMDGVTGTSNITDSSISPKTITNTSVTHSNTQSKFGDTSAALNGSTSYLSVPASSDFAFGTGNFTVEAFIYLTSTPAGSGIITEIFTGAGDSVQLALAFCDGSPGSAGGSRPFFGHYNGAWSGAVAASALSNSTWHHIAGVRNGNTWTLFINGNSSASATISVNIALDEAVLVGRRWDIAGTPYFPGYIDEVRITKGVARYTGNFTPPTAPFPNS